MKLSEIAVARPVATILMTVAVAIAGAIAFTVLPVSPLPATDMPAIYVSASLPGANPEVMASSVTTPLERQLSHIAGITEMTSRSSSGSASISIQFDLDRDVNAAARDVQAAISQARNFLPTNMPQNPTYRKMNSADQPIVIMSLSSTTHDVNARYDAASTILMQRLSQIPGVGQVSIGGGSLPAVRIELNPLQLQQYGISPTDVASFLRAQNAHSPTGYVEEGDSVSYIRVNDQISKAADYRPLVIRTIKGNAVRLQDVATVTDSTESIRNAGYTNGVSSITLVVYKQAGANIVETVDRIKAELPTLQASIPSGMKLAISLDRTTTIRASLKDVERTMAISIALVILVVFVFLRDWRATIIPGISVPVSLIGTFGAMYLLDYSLDNLSLMALTISTGFVIDDAIVVMENIARYVEQGEKTATAVLKGAREIGFTVVSMSISLVAVFIPILMMGGIVGRLFREFAITLTVAISISMALSLTTTPMLCSLLFKSSTKERKHGKLFWLIENFFQRLRSGYQRSLRWAICDHAVLVLIVFMATVMLVVVYMIRIPKGFFPTQDTGTIMGGLIGTPDSSFDKMNGALAKAVQIVKADPAVQNVIGSVGGGGFGGASAANMFIELKPLAERKLSATQVVDRLRPKLMTIKEGQTFLMAGQDLRVGGRQANAQYQYTLQADSTADLKYWVPKLANEMKKISIITDVNSDLQAGGLQAYLTFNRDAAARMGVTPRDIDNALNYSYSQAMASTIYKSLNQYHVILEADPKFSTSPDSLDNTYVRTSNGSIPLSILSDYTMRTGPVTIAHTGQSPSSTISFNLADGVTLGEAEEAVHGVENHMHIPNAVHGVFTGTAQELSKLGNLWVLVLTALLVIYIVLGILYESFMHPITILTTLPSAALGAVVTLILFNSDLNVISMIGIVLVVGLVMKNAILMIDFAVQQERDHNLTTEEAIQRACALRFRPILMTTASAFFGAMPMAFGHGIGSELRRPLGLTIMGGLMVSQIMTLYTTPVVYLMLDRMRLWLRSHLTFLVGAPAEETL